MGCFYGEKLFWQMLNEKTLIITNCSALAFFVLVLRLHSSDKHNNKDALGEDAVQKLHQRMGCYGEILLLCLSDTYGQE